MGLVIEPTPEEAARFRAQLQAVITAIRGSLQKAIQEAAGNISVADVSIRFVKKARRMEIVIYFEFPTTEHYEVMKRLVRGEI